MGNGTVGMTKDELRAHWRDVRESMGQAAREAADAAIAEQVAKLPAFASAEIVFAYLSVGAEVDTRRLIRMAWEGGKLVVIPRCIPGSNKMEWHRIESFEHLVSGSFGIEEPAADDSTLLQVAQLEPGTSAVALVPGYSFDAAGYRLGYGGGFYDVFLPEFNGASIGLCRARQYSDQPLPHDAHDVPVHVVVCEQGAMR